MTGADIVTMYQTMVRDTMDSVLEYQLLNVAKDRIEEERDWAFLKKLDASQTASSALNTFPTDYSRTLKMCVNNQEYLEIPFEEQKVYANSGLRWYSDLAAGGFYLLGSNLSGTINHFYARFTDPIISTTSPVWPARFHALIAFEMAADYFTVDQGDRARSWDDKYEIKYQQLRNAMISWNAALKRRSDENTNMYDPDADFPLSMM